MVKSNKFWWCSYQVEVHYSRTPRKPSKDISPKSDQPQINGDVDGLDTLSHWKNGFLLRAPFFSDTELQRLQQSPGKCHGMMRTKLGCFLHTEIVSHCNPARQSANLFFYIVSSNTHTKTGSKIHHNARPSVAALISVSKRKWKGSNKVEGKRQDLNDCNGGTRRRTTTIWRWMRIPAAAVGQQRKPVLLRSTN